MDGSDSRRGWRLSAFVGALMASGALACACSSAPSTHPPVTASTSTSAVTSTSGPTTTAPPVTVTLPPTTTVPIPSAPQPSADAAASALVSSWASNNRSRALTVAVPNAVSVLFAVPFPGSLAISRGCTSAFPPIVCTYGPPGGGNSNDPIYQVYVAQAPGGWYVSNAVIEH